MRQLDKKVVFVFGRFQPPTRGHAHLINYAYGLALAQNADFRVYSSRTFDGKNNPLTFEQKLKFLHAMFPYRDCFMDDQKVDDPYEAFGRLAEDGYTHVWFVCGADRASKFSLWVPKYVSKWGFRHCEVVTAGARDGNAAIEDSSVYAVSATAARTAALHDNFNLFRQYLPSDNVTVPMAATIYQAIRRGMGIAVP